MNNIQHQSEQQQLESVQQPRPSLVQPHLSLQEPSELSKAKQLQTTNQPIAQYQQKATGLRRFGKELQNLLFAANPMSSRAEKSKNGDPKEIAKEGKLAKAAKRNSKSRTKNNGSAANKKQTEELKQRGPDNQKQLLTNAPIINSRLYLLNQYFDPNPYACREYEQQIHDFLRSEDSNYSVNPLYMSHQPEVTDKMRAILIDWLVDVHIRFGLHPETLFIAVNLIDRYLALQIVPKSKLQLVGVVALMLATKFEEIYPPEIKDFIFITDNAYQRHDLVQMECAMILTLSFDFAVPTAFRFLQKYILSFTNDHTIAQFAHYLIEQSLVEIKMIMYPQQVIAASALYLSYTRISYDRQQVQGMQESNDQMQIDNSVALPQFAELVQLTEDTLTPCLRDLEDLYHISAKSTLRAVRCKYLQSQFASIHYLLREQQTHQ